MSAAFLATRLGGIKILYAKRLTQPPQQRRGPSEEMIAMAPGFRLMVFHVRCRAYRLCDRPSGWAYYSQISQKSRGRNANPGNSERNEFN